MSTNQIEHNKEIFNLADEFLLGLAKTYVLKSDRSSNGEIRQVLAKYLHPEERPRSLVGKDGVFHHLVHTAQDWGMAPKVIGRSIGGDDKLEDVLFGFNPQRVVEKYPNVNEWEALLDSIVTELKPKGKIRRGNRSLWPRYCHSIISSALFISQFESVADFYGWVAPLERDAARRIELPQRLERQIVGYGFALACIFFMEIGYASFLKPDIWVIRFCNKLNITSSRDPYNVFNAAVQFAEQLGITPFCLDRMVWLIGTGEFWLDKVDIGSQLNNFTSFAHERLKRLAE